MVLGMEILMVLNDDRPDKWILEFKPDMDLYKDFEFDVFETTFSNSPCFTNYCLHNHIQTTYPNENIPKKGSFD